MGCFMKHQRLCLFWLPCRISADGKRLELLCGSSPTGRTLRWFDATDADFDSEAIDHS
jgi:hypothetical protein